VSPPAGIEDAAGGDDRVALGMFPTPLEPLDRLSAHLGGPRVWVKRDDATGLAGGGNKVRKLEYLLGDALRNQADVVLTCGAVQSNHARLTAASCARLGLACELWLNRRVAGRDAGYEHTGNILLDHLFDARVELLAGDADAAAAADRRAAQLLADGARPYVIPIGGSNPVGARGYVACADELLDQASRLGVRIDAVFVTAGSHGTIAGLSVGLAARGFTGQLVGVTISEPQAAAAAHVHALASDTAAALGQPGCVLDVTIDDRFIGEGYGIPTAAGIASIRLAARLEGLLLDPVYTGKTMAAMTAAITSGSYPADANIVFIHTGGWPALFAYQSALE
jgi:L-cysteate sulfo-lyase